MLPAPKRRFVGRFTAHNCSHQVVRNAGSNRIRKRKTAWDDRNTGNLNATKRPKLAKNLSFRAFWRPLFYPSSRRLRFFLRSDGRLLRWRHLAAGNKRGPGLSRFGRVLRCLAGHRRNANEVIAIRALNLAPGKLLVTLQMLVALRTGELKRVHSMCCLIPDNGTRRNKIQCEIGANQEI